MATRGENGWVSWVKERSEPSQRDASRRLINAMKTESTGAL